MVVVSKAGMPDSNFWKDKRVLVTGHTGFKGGWLVMWLHRMGAKVSGLSIPPFTQPNLFELASVDSICDSYICDIRNKERLNKIFDENQIDLIIHCAAEILDEKNPDEVWKTNFNGTKNILDLAEQYKISKFIFTSTFSIFEKNYSSPIDEKEP